ncbi:MAG: hypothetical protein ABI165_16445 [Bryobacteraceae bacterium]
MRITAVVLLWIALAGCENDKNTVKTPVPQTPAPSNVLPAR